MACCRRSGGDTDGIAPTRLRFHAVAPDGTSFPFDTVREARAVADPQGWKVEPRRERVAPA